ncbi:MAG: DUF58 domain-containing protein [Verrucomicrobiales bacterium]
MTSNQTQQEQLFDPQFLDRLRALFFRLRKRRKLRRKGIQATPTTGFTREFKDFRHYTPRDDYRAIDWRVYARLDRLFIRLYEEVQEFHLHIVIDTSGSMLEPHPEKRRASLKLAVALSYLGLVSQHRVTLYTMGEGVVDALPPLKGQGNIQKIIDHVTDLEYGGVTDLESCFRELRPSRQRFGVIFVLSDFFGTEIGSASAALRHASSWPGEAHLIHLFSPLERDPEFDGEVEVVDVETREMRRLWFTVRDRERYREEFERFRGELERGCLRRQVDYLEWVTDRDFEEMFLALLSRGSVLAGGA